MRRAERTARRAALRASGAPAAGALEPRTYRFLAAGIVGIVQLLFDLAAAGHLSPRYEDGDAYHRLAVGLAHHFQYGPPSAYRPPGWPVVLAAFYRVFGIHPNVGLGINLVVAASAAFLIVLLGEQLGLSALQAACAAVLAGLFPWTLVLGATLYGETFFTALLVLIVLLMLRAPGKGLARWLVVGLLAGAAMLVRPVLAFWVPAAALFTYLADRRWRALGVLIVGMVAVLSVWTVRNAVELHAFVPLTTAGGNTIALANNDRAEAGQSANGLPHLPRQSEVERDKAYRTFAVHWIEHHPATFAARVPERLVRTFDPVTRLNKGVFGPRPLQWVARLVWLLLMVPVVWGAWLRNRGDWLLVVLTVITVLFPVVLFGGGFRFLVPTVPFLALWGVVGATDLISRLGRARQDPVPLAQGREP